MPVRGAHRVAFPTQSARINARRNGVLGVYYSRTMNAPTHLPSPGHRTRIKLVGLAALCSIIVLIVWAARRETAVEKQIHCALAELRASGEPISAQDLAHLFPNPSANEDAGV